MTLEEKISEIPPESEWWDSDSDETFQNLAKELIKKGYSEDDAVEFLETAYFAVSACYGN